MEELVKLLGGREKAVVVAKTWNNFQSALGNKPAVHAKLKELLGREGVVGGNEPALEGSTVNPLTSWSDFRTFAWACEIVPTFFLSSKIEKHVGYPARGVNSQKKGFEKDIDAMFSPVSNELLFSRGLVDDLPEPARRYLIHAIAPGAPTIKVANLRFVGKLRSRGKLANFEATESLVPNKSFDWNAKIGGFPFGIKGRDWLNESSLGGQEYQRLGGLLGGKTATGPEVTRSQIGRLCLESIFAPTGLLPSRNGVRWEPSGDKNTAVARWSLGSEDVKLVLRLKPSGQLAEAIVDRWGTLGGPYAYQRYGCVVEEEKAFDWYTIPHSFRMGWYLGRNSGIPVEGLLYQATVQNAWFD
eukprot:jgi/Mesvir1/18089/Mv09390-RA.1